ncbi:MAG: hypothetical protein KatS3mg091_382 [Patescibacteria group bacterium]|nr:MAG: hypothetical protein KatS3mg091_382 [Patescibacteria group bacterium]
MQKNYNNYSLSDLIKIISSDQNRFEVFNQLNDNLQAEVLSKLNKKIQKQIIKKLSDDQLYEIFKSLDPVILYDFIKFLDAGRRNKVLSRFDNHIQKSLKMLNKLSKDSAIGLMSFDYIQVNVNDRIADVSDRIKLHEKRTGKIPVIFVMDKGKLKGYLPIDKLVLAHPKKSVFFFMKKIITIKPHTPAEKIIRYFKNFPHSKAAVVDETGDILGVIYADDILDYIIKKDSITLYNLAGVDNEESVLDSALTKVRYRYKWLILNLATAFLAAFTVKLFDNVISKYVLLAVYMPIVAGMGGNSATQTLAVIVRALVLKQ